MEIILASGSPRRREILERLGVRFSVIVSDKEEKINNDTPEECVKRLAKMKAEDIFEQLKNDGEDDFLVIGADTVVALDGRILTKPKDAADAARMLKSLSGRTHQVYTGVFVAVSKNGKRENISFAERSDVFVSELLDSEILKYIATKEPFDKAGGYAVQGLFAPYIERIEGDYYNIVGLPLSRLFRELKKIQITIA